MNNGALLVEEGIVAICVTVVAVARLTAWILHA